MTLYEKRGRRYVPVHDTAACDGLPNGVWALKVADGSRHSVLAANLPAACGALAAVPDLTEWLCDAIREATAAHPVRHPAALEKKALAAFAAILGPDATMMLSRESAWGAASKVARKLAEAAEHQHKEAE